MSFAEDILDGQVAIVSGGGSGIGRATVLQLIALVRASRAHGELSCVSMLRS